MIEEKKLFIEIRSDENISDKKTDLFLAISDGKNLQDIKIKFSDLEKPFNNSFYKFFVLAFLGGFFFIKPNALRSSSSIFKTDVSSQSSFF